MRDCPHNGAKWTSELQGERIKQVTRAGDATVIRAKGISSLLPYPKRVRLAFEPPGASPVVFLSKFQQPNWGGTADSTSVPCSIGTDVFCSFRMNPFFSYNINADSPVVPTPVLNPQTQQPITPDDLSVLFPMDLIMQEVSTERFIEIPEEVRESYKLYRPTPLIRARRLEKALGTPAHIYYKNESVSPSGSHKANTAIAQAFYNKIGGTKAMTTETGAGQWGSALAMACKSFDIPLEVYMVKVSYRQKPYRRNLMETFGAQVFASPTNLTDSGRAALAKDPNNPGSLGIAISEAVEVAAKSNGLKKYGLGSVLHHVRNA